MIFKFRCDIIQKSRKYAAMAQSVEHVIGNDEVISSILITSSKTKSTSKEVLFVLEMKRADAHEASCGATREVGLRPMKRAFGPRRGNVALRFMATKLPPHTSVASASYRRKPMLHLKLPPPVLKNTENCAIIRLTQVSNDGKAETYEKY